MKQRRLFILLLFFQQQFLVAAKSPNKRRRQKKHRKRKPRAADFHLSSRIGNDFVSGSRDTEALVTSNNVFDSSIPTSRTFSYQENVEQAAPLNDEYPESALNSRQITGVNNEDDLVVTKRIVGGRDAEPHSFHSMLFIRYGGGWRWAGGGATLVSNCHVVTAAHVIDTVNPPGGVFVNAHRPYQMNGDVPFHFSTVAQIIQHRDYNSTTNANDIAVIKMENCLNTTEFPYAIPASPETGLPTWQEQQNDSAARSGVVNVNLNYGQETEPPQQQFFGDIMGFGKLIETGSIFTTVEALQIAQVPLIPNATCREYYGDRITSDMFCAGYTEGGVDACQGDSGSSMTYMDPKTGDTILLGVISWGEGCGRSQSELLFNVFRRLFRCIGL